MGKYQLFLKQFDSFDNSNGSNDFMHSGSIDFKEINSIKSCVRHLAEIYNSYSHYWKIKAADKSEKIYQKQNKKKDIIQFFIW